MPDMPASYYDRFEPDDNYDRHLFRGGKVLQSAEMNEIQLSLLHRMRGVSDVLFRDGDVIRDCVVVVDPDTGETTCSSGAVYLQGMVRGIAPGELTIPISGIVTIGIRMVESVVTELEDSGLLDPAQTLRNFGQPGAARLKVELVWGWDGDEEDGEFFPMFTVEDGVLRAKQAPPTIDAVRQAIGDYDRQSTGGNYVVNGLECLVLPDNGGEQVYSVGSGAARVRGYGVEFQSSRRIAFDPEPDLRFIDSEPHLSGGVGAQRIDLNLTPVQNITEVTITAQGSETLTRGGIAGGQDQIAQSSVLSIVSVVQGGTTYVQGVDYQLTAGKVDWSLAGAEPATGSTYTVTYQYITEVEPTLVDATGCTVTGAVAGTAILVSYNQMLPRYDRICINEEGGLVWFKGVAASFNPVAPEIPETLLPIATIYQTWGADRTIIADGVRVVSMQELASIDSKLERILMLVAQQRLESSVSIRQTGAVKGVFTDPFIDDTMRDAGTAQTGAIISGTLTLPTTVHFADCDSRPDGTASTLLFSPDTTFAVEQLARTGSMKVNPYSAFEPLPAQVTLRPSIDRWVDHQEEWTSADSRSITNWAPLADPTMGGRLFNAVFGWEESTQTSREVVTVGSRTTRAANLRQIEVRFTISGFGAGETLTSVAFDGIPVTASAI